MDIRSLREEYQQERRALEADFQAGRKSRDFLEGHTGLLDRMIQGLSQTHLSTGDFAVIALAGYGRRQMLPFSDVDLLIVHECSDPDVVQRVVTPFVTDLWDLTSDLGHQVWAYSDLTGLDPSEHYEFILALRDGRYLAGNRELASRVLDNLFPRIFQGNRAFFLEIIHREVEKRYRQQKYTIFQLEPDVKESPGGLRDHLAASWMEDLAGEPPFSKYSAADLDAAHEFMLALRIQLHLLTGRNDNKLSISRQEKISFILSPLDGEPASQKEIRQAIETFMKQYYTNARILNDRCRTMLDVTRSGPRPKELGASDLAQPVSMASVLEVFARAVEEGSSLSYELKEFIKSHMEDLEREGAGPGLKPLLFRFLHPSRGMSALLRDLYDLGILEIIFPEFRAIKARFCWDYYHRYTVDEHTILALRNIERLAPPREGISESDPSDRRFASLLEESSNPVLINLALLYHDIGKGREGNHSETGAELADIAMDRIGLTAQEREEVKFLILNHLAMSTVVFHRDHNDHKVLNEFAGLVENTETLRRLTLLTYADVKAVGPGTLTEWKRDQLWDVYVKAYRKLTLGFGEERIDEDDLGFADKLIDSLPVNLDRNRFAEFLEGFPLSYLRTEPNRIYGHFELANRLSPEEPVQSSISSNDGLYELCVVTPDRRRLFARIAGMLSYFDMNIVKGYGFANSQDVVLDFFEFFDTGDRFRHSREIQRFRRILHDVLTGRASIREMLERKTVSPLVQKMGKLEPVVYFEDDPERKMTLMEIISPDKPGLLYSIGSILASAGCDIELLLINTEGEKAVDVFYLRHNNVTLPEELKESLRAEILGSLI